MAVKATVATRAPRGTKILMQAFFSAADAIPETQRDAVIKAALAGIREKLAENRAKAKATKTKVKTAKAAIVKAATGTKTKSAARSKTKAVAAAPKRAVQTKPVRKPAADPAPAAEPTAPAE